MELYCRRSYETADAAEMQATAMAAELADYGDENTDGKEFQRRRLTCRRRRALRTT